MHLVRLAAVVLGALTMQAGDLPVLRPAPDFVVHFPDGHQTSLSSLRGKVVALSCVFTTCPHCQHASQVFSKLYKEYGSRGFQPMGVAFNVMANLYVDDFVKTYEVAYPVGYSAPDAVLGFLGIPVIERYVVPQIVWIDRKGYIRSQTTALGDQKYLEESYWRQMIETLTKEPVESTKKATPVRSAKK